MYFTIYSIMVVMTAKAYYVEKINPVKSLLLTFMIGILAFILSSIYVANFVFNSNRWKDLLAEEEKEIKYEEKYPYEKIPDTEKEICEKNYVFDKTPDLYKSIIVVMKYNKKDEAFWYWNETPSSVRYEFLETVARKYVTRFKCKNIYIDRKTTLENDKKEEKEKEEKIKKQMEKWKTKKDKNEDVFAKLKKPVEKRKKKITAPSKANKYVHKGKIDEMSLFQPLLNRDKQKKKIKNDVSWGEWFKINNSKEV